MNGSGEKMEESVILEIEKYLDGEMGELPLAKRDQIGRTQDFAAGRNRYIGYLISIATRSFKGKKVEMCIRDSAGTDHQGAGRFHDPGGHRRCGGSVRLEEIPGGELSGNVSGRVF